MPVKLTLSIFSGRPNPTPRLGSCLHEPNCYKTKNRCELLSSQYMNLRKRQTSKNYSKLSYASMVRGDTNHGDSEEDFNEDEFN